MTENHRRIVVTARSFDETATAYLRESGCVVDHVSLPPGSNDGSLGVETLIERLKGAQGWIVGHAHVTSDVLARLPDLKIVARAGVGYDRVDLEAARKAGLVVTIAAGGNDASVADHTIGLMLAVLRRLRESRIAMENGDWTIPTTGDLHLKTVGIIGLGRVGKSVVRRLKGFDCRVLVNSRTPDPDYAAENDVCFVDLETLLRDSDIVSVHAPLTPATRFLLDADALGRMKKAATLINVGRGGLVDDRSLLDALLEKRLAGAGLDVFASESDPVFKPVTARLLALPNVVATPHSAASSAEGLARTNLLAARAVVTVLEGGQPPAGQVVADGRLSLEDCGT
ncbi:phosphoglycerate dehydrogenase [Neorhizobium sp. S3-V5DH]|uniref:phosphoglycerate dehydrogenase n=1 Tax=Neorhizobium sp. S3-V5DH TaxID=2485166 RepID=UPI001042AB4B|nr:phosphoglycerate dehydrogenase [Neorhizobium sp. S3-V5DH]TCV67425.1 D-3-phosphoglycerate dehydrogenase [Neorhizobium sp. S3-V5DH]